MTIKLLSCRFRTLLPLLLVAAAILPTAGCGGSDSSASGVLRLATTTSTRDSGLLDQLLPDFEKQHGCRVDVVAKGTGAALKLGEGGDADVLIVHAREAENAFMDAGHGVRHAEFMTNYFTILGPAADPAVAKGQPPAEVLKRIAAAKVKFLSRGDDSGTHKRELSLWKAVGGRPEWDGYLETGQGMGRTLTMADEMQGYVITDVGTYLKFQDKIDLVPLATASDDLRNPYAAIVVNPNKHERINSKLAGLLVDYLISDTAQKKIGEYRAAGERLFLPTRLLVEGRAKPQDEAGPSSQQKVTQQQATQQENSE